MAESSLFDWKGLSKIFQLDKSSAVKLASDSKNKITIEQIKMDIECCFPS